MLNEKTRKPGEPINDAKKHPMVVINLASLLITYVQDPEIIQEIYSGRGSKSIDKSDIVSKMFSCYMGDMFAFMHTDETWKAHRKAISHMFFKQKLVIMAKVYK